MFFKLSTEPFLRSEIWGSFLQPTPSLPPNSSSNLSIPFKPKSRLAYAASHEPFSKITDNGNMASISNEKVSNSQKTSPYTPMNQRYRPFSFEELIGQKLPARILRNSVDRGRIRPAYLFSGPKGTGKTSAARILAAALNCTGKKNKVGEPCGCCKDCLTVKSGSNIDVREVDAASNSGVESMRNLLETVRYAPVCGKYKVYIIDECHMLSSEAEHALLKTLEEPPPFVVFVLITTDPQRMLRTVKSRCEPFKFQRIADKSIIEHMRQLAGREGMNVEEDALRLMVQLAEGSLRDATSMLDQLSLVGDTITSNIVQELMGVASDSEMILLLRDVLTANQETAVRERVEKLLDYGTEPSAILSHLVSIVMNLLTDVSRVKPLPSSSSSSVMSSEEREARSLLVDLAGLVYGKDMLRCALSAFAEAEKQVRANPNPHLWLKVSLLQLPLQLSSPSPSNPPIDVESHIVSSSSPSSFPLNKATVRVEEEEAINPPPSPSPLFKDDVFSPSNHSLTVSSTSPIESSLLHEEENLNSDSINDLVKPSVDFSQNDLTEVVSSMSPLNHHPLKKEEVGKGEREEEEGRSINGDDTSSPTIDLDQVNDSDHSINNFKKEVEENSMLDDVQVVSVKDTQVADESTQVVVQDAQVSDPLDADSRVHKYAFVEDEMILQEVFDQAVKMLKRSSARQKVLMNEGKLVRILSSQVFLEFPKAWLPKVAQSFYRSKYLSIFKEIIGEDATIKINVRNDVLEERNTENGVIDSTEKRVEKEGKPAKKKTMADASRSSVSVKGRGKEKDEMDSPSIDFVSASKSAKEGEEGKAKASRQKRNVMAKNVMKRSVEEEDNYNTRNDDVKEKPDIVKDTIDSEFELEKMEESKEKSHFSNDDDNRTFSKIVDKFDDAEKDLSDLFSSYSTSLNNHPSIIDPTSFKEEEEEKKKDGSDVETMVMTHQASLNPAQNQSQSQSQVLNVKTRASSPSQRSSRLHESNTHKMMSAEIIAHNFASAFDGSVFRM